MAGGILAVLGITGDEGTGHRAKFVGTGMHGGTIYIRGDVPHTGNNVNCMELDNNDRKLLGSLIEEFCTYFKLDQTKIPLEEFIKLVPSSLRPYGTLYAQKKK
jgi:glutamate synthase domain-containing protein 3